MIPLNSITNPNIDNSDLVNYPNGRIKDNDGTGNGTGVNRNIYGDLHSNISKLMRLYAITPNNLPDNETSGFQIIEALRGLASKNDFIYPLTTNGTVLSVDIKFSQMLVNEFVVCLAQFNKGAETQIKGESASLFNITYSGNFKTNEYIRIIKTNTGISIIRLADALSLDAMVNDFAYLKKAIQAEENAGAIDTVATTPLTNLVAFTRRVIGSDSGNYLATSLRNGLYPKEHFAIVAGIGSSPVKNIGWFSGLNISVGGTINYPVGGDIASAQSFVLASQSNEQFILVTMANLMEDTNYYVRSFNESQGDIRDDNDINGVVFKPISTSQFQISMRESANGVQNLKIHLEVVQL